MINRDNLFGGIFDINGDGQTDGGEEWLAFMLFSGLFDEDDDEAEDIENE